MGEVVTADDRLFIVCDGMGGHDSGEVASRLVCETMRSYIKERQQPADGRERSEVLFQDALSAAYDALDAADTGAAKKMGTTLTLALFHAEGCLLAHIGDSRIYHIRPEGKQMLYKSRDHSLVNNLYELGEITKEEMKTSPQRNIITRAMQPLQERRAKAAVNHTADIKQGDYFYLCTDGMLEDVEDEEIVNIISMNTSSEEKRRILAARSAEARDNHSAYLVGKN